MSKPPDAPALEALRASAHDELVARILPYWMTHTLDGVHGGYFGRITQGGVVDTAAPKGAVLNARILWTFASAARVLQDDRYVPFADRAYRALRTHFWDEAYGGVYWSVTPTGAIHEPEKRVYAQAFLLYALAEYVRLRPAPAVLAWALEVYHLIERHTADPAHGGYFEVYSRDWQRLERGRLSEKDLAAPKSMNTNLHVLEAFTNLYRVWPDPGLGTSLTRLVRLFTDRVVDTETHALLPFFTADWTSLADEVSYGHDIEASWLLLEAAELVGDAALRAEVRALAVAMAEAVRHHGVDTDGAVLYTRHPDGHLDDDKHWWPQAEAVVGFLNAYQVSGQTRFLDAATASWDFITSYLVDAEHGEWYGRLRRSREPYRDEDKVGLWKCPYHNGRACLEVIERVCHLVHGGNGAPSYPEVPGPSSASGQ